MSEMVERLAKTLSFGLCDYTPETCKMDECLCRWAARAAIKHMREPTQDMFDRGIEAMQDMDGESKQANLKHLWPAMIDEAAE